MLKIKKNLFRLKADVFRFFSFLIGNSDLGARLRFHGLRILGVSFKGTCKIFSGFEFLSVNKNLFIGKNCFININCLMDLTDKIYIGDNVLIGPNVSFITSTHKVLFVDRPRPVESLGTIVVEDNVFIGANTTIFGGVIIGNNSVIGACSLVNKSIPPNSIAFGNPAKVTRTL